MKIYYKLNLLIIFLLVSLTLVVTTSVNFMMNDALEQEMMELELTIAEYVTEDLANPLLQKDTMEVNEIIDNVMIRNTDIRYVYVVDFDGVVVAHTFSKAFSADMVTANPIPPNENTAVRILSVEGESIQDVGVRVLDGMDAKVYFGFSRTHLITSINKTTNAIISTAALVLLLGIFMSFLLTSTLTSPIEKLVAGINRVAEGDLDFQVEVTTSDDIGVLTDSFNRMVAEIKQAEANIRHLNSVLEAIRNVNQLIVVETDRDILLQKTCDTLVDARSYVAVWLGFIQNGETFATVKSSGFKGDVSRFSEYVAGGNYPSCIREMLADNDMFTIIDKSQECVDCPFKDAFSSQEVMISRIEHSGRLFGLLAVSITSDDGVDKEEEGLLQEVASDIGLAFYKMEIEEAHKKTEEELKESEERYRSLHTAANEGIALHEMIYDESGTPVDYRILDINPAFESILGIKKKDALGAKASELYGTGEAPYLDIYAKVADTREPITFETAFDLMGKSFKISVFSPAKGMFATLFADITEHKKAEYKIHKLNQELDKRVQERTAELEDKNAELEHMNSVFVGRELRMAELKKQIAELEEKYSDSDGRT